MEGASPSGGRDDLKPWLIENREEEFLNYLRFGGMPVIHTMEWTEEAVYQYLQSVFDTVILNDVIIRNGVRNAVLLESLIRFLADNIGSFYSAKSISDYLTSAGRKTTASTVIEYIHYLVNAYALHDVKRFDLRGKKQLASPETLEREFSALDMIPDNYPKMVLSMDRGIPPGNGIQQIYIPDFLMNPVKYLP